MIEIVIVIAVVVIIGINVLTQDSADGYIRM